MEINNFNLILVHEQAIKIIQANSEAFIKADEAVILAIFHVFNPDNSGMNEEEIQEIFDAYSVYVKNLLLN